MATCPCDERIHPPEPVTNLVEARAHEIFVGDVYGKRPPFSVVRKR